MWSPSPFITEETRQNVCNMAVQLAKSVGYYNAGTVECLVDKHQNYYFLEMNTRLQVEHPITEEVTQTDLVKAQILVAQGEELPWKQEELKQTGHAFECRVYAEDPFHNFRPAPGPVVEQQYPHGPGIRLDNGIFKGYNIPLEYDPILSKLVVWGKDRSEALTRLKRALSEYRVSGPKTNLYFHLKAIEQKAFIEGKYDTHFIDQYLEEILKIPEEGKSKALMIAALTRYLLDEKKQGLSSSTSDQKESSAWLRAGRLRQLGN